MNPNVQLKTRYGKRFMALKPQDTREQAEQLFNRVIHLDPDLHITEDKRTHKFLVWTRTS